MRVLHETKIFRRVVCNTKIDTESENIEYPGTASSFKVCKSVGVRIVKHREDGRLEDVKAVATRSDPTQDKAAQK